MLDEAVADPTITLDVFAYDLNEPDLVARLEQLGPRLRIIVDDSTVEEGRCRHRPRRRPQQRERGGGAARGDGRCRSCAAHPLQRPAASQGVHRQSRRRAVQGACRLHQLQLPRPVHPVEQRPGVRRIPALAALYREVFEASFVNRAASSSSTGEEVAAPPPTPAVPVHVCFSPHSSSALPLNPVRGAIEQASSSVFYAVAFLNQLKSGPTKEAFDRLIERADLQLRPLRQGRRPGDHQARRQRRPGRLRLPREERTRAVQVGMERRQGDQRAPQVRGHRFQPADRQGVHRLVQPGAQRRERQRRPPADDRGPEDRHRPTRSRRCASSTTCTSAARRRRPG